MTEYRGASQSPLMVGLLRLLVGTVGVTLAAGLSMLVLGCGSPPAPSTIAPGVPTPEVRYTRIALDPGRGAADMIGEDGGEMTVTGTNGAEFTLRIPEGALLESQTITLTPVVDIVDLPPDATLVAAVHMEPEGLVLFTPATLTVDLPSGVRADELIGFGYRGDGDDFHLQWAPVAESTATFSLTHFSGNGLKEFTGTDCPPGGPFLFEENRAKARIACALFDAAQQQFFSDDLDVDVTELQLALDDWFEIQVKPALVEARECWQNPGCDRELILETAVSFFLAWRFEAIFLEQFVGWSPLLSDLDQQGRILTGLAFEAAVTTTAEECRATDPPTEFTFSTQATTVEVSEGGAVTGVAVGSATVDAMADAQRVEKVETVVRLQEQMRRIGFPELEPLRQDGATLCGAVKVEPPIATLAIGESAMLSASVVDSSTVVSPDAVFGSADIVVLSAPDTTPPEVGFSWNLRPMPFDPPRVSGTWWVRDYASGVVLVELFVGPSPLTELADAGFRQELFSSSTPSQGVEGGSWEYRLPEGARQCGYASGDVIGLFDILIVATDAAGSRSLNNVVTLDLCT